MKVEVAVLGSPSLISLVVSVDVKATPKRVRRVVQGSAAGFTSTLAPSRCTSLLELTAFGVFVRNQVVLTRVRQDCGNYFSSSIPPSMPGLDRLRAVKRGFVFDFFICFAAPSSRERGGGEGHEAETEEEVERGKEEDKRV